MADARRHDAVRGQERHRGLFNHKQMDRNGVTAPDQQPGMSAVLQVHVHHIPDAERRVPGIVPPRVSEHQVLLPAALFVAPQVQLLARLLHLTPTPSDAYSI